LMSNVHHQSDASRSDHMFNVLISLMLQWSDVQCSYHQSDAQWSDVQCSIISLMLTV
ncbi:hypothetical protein CDAR_240031, partial [Caerostris darwini]